MAEAARAGREDRVTGKGTAPSPANEEPMLHPRRFLTGPEYAREIRVYIILGLVVAALLALSGCGDSSGGNGGQPGAGPPTTTAASTNETTDGIDPLEGAGTTPVEGAATASETTLLERVAIGRHEGFDRVVFQFRDHLPGYRVEYVEPPLKEDGSGNVVQVKGSA